MLVRLPVCIALILLVVAGHASIANDQEQNRVELTTNKIVIDSRLPDTKSDIRNSATRQTRVLFITMKDCDRCEQELNRLRKPGGDFEKLQSVGWKIGEGNHNHIQIVDRDSIPELMDLLKSREYPAVACVVDGEIVRSFKEGCTTPLDSWTFGWLLKGVSERPKGAISEAARVETTGNYHRLRGNHWTIEGDPNPTKEAVINHLRSVNHANSVSPYGAIENWSTEELRSLHDDIHEREGGGVATVFYGQSQPQAANRSLEAFSGSRKVMGR
jgi:hypothetical protein